MHNYLFFFKQLRSEYNKIKKAYAHKCPAFYPNFQAIDKIEGLPVAQFIEKYPSNGFITNYCISFEERMVVKQYKRQHAKNEEEEYFYLY